jgi:hypothetical protein
MEKKKQNSGKMIGRVERRRRMNYQFRGVGVDAGIIMICDEEYYKKYGYKFDKKLSFKRKVPNGRYNCKWSIPNTWNGSVEGDGVLEVTSGTIIVSDPCYLIQDEGNSQAAWDKFLNDTEFGSNPAEGTLILDKMGGDGDYTVNVSLQLT